MRLIDADDFGNRMYHEAFEKDSDLQKWDSGCWIRYKLFENVLREQPTVQPDHNADIGKKAEGDCISRQAAIDALQKEINKGIPPFDDVMGSIRCGVRLARNIIEDLPLAAPSTAQTTEATAPSTDDWIPVERELPEDLAEVNVTWVNHEPEPYYEFIKSKPFTASAVFYKGKWYWYSSVCADVLGEYGRNDVDKVDDAIEITAWKPLPEPYRGGDE